MATRKTNKVSKAGKPTKQSPKATAPVDVLKAFGALIGGWGKWSTAQCGRKPTKAEIELAMSLCQRMGKRPVGREVLATAMYCRAGYGATDEQARRLGLATPTGGYNRNVRRDLVTFGHATLVDTAPRADVKGGRVHTVFTLALPKARTPRKPRATKARTAVKPVTTAQTTTSTAVAPTAPTQAPTA